MATATSATAAEVPPAQDSLAYIAPDIPDSLKASFGAWIKGNAQAESAKAELHLYRHSGYFKGATINNVPNLPLAQAWAALKAGSNLGVPPKPRPEERATIGTALDSTDGKVGMIRLVNLHREGQTSSQQGVGSWLSSWIPSSTSSKAVSNDAGSSTDTQEPASLVGRSATTSCGEPRSINMLEIGTPETKPGETKIVLLHGYGAGTAFFFQNLRSLASIPNSRLFALDWLGMGRSSRPPFHIPNSVTKQGVEARVKAAESFFVDSLEEWRQKMELERMTLVGHSLGGYLTIAYALRYPHRVDKIVLISPAGIAENPQETQKELAFQSKNNAVGADATQELLDDQSKIAPRSKAEEERTKAEMRSVASSSSSDIRGAEPQGPIKSTAEEVEEERQNPPRLSNRTRAVLGWLWDQNMSPFAIIRASTFLGPLMTGRYTSRRFSLLPDDDLRALHAYCHGIFTAKGSSEYCLAHILAPGAFARLPMLHRLTPLRVPVSFIYGQYDWMDVTAGRAAVKALAEAGNKNASCTVVPLAGHHTYLDNPDACNAVVEEFLKKPVLAQL
ncbi:hypothetical protein CF326_g2336 [Tilletia indica]|nr:hypothetical protein CF326_g2336 [Tilletia indica]